MTAYNLKNIIDGVQLTNAVATYYTTPDNTRCELRKLSFTNTSAAAVTVTVYIVPSGGTASDANTIKKTKALAPAGFGSDTWNCIEALGHCLNAGETVQAVCSANTSVSVRCTGLEIVG